MPWDRLKCRFTGSGDIEVERLDDREAPGDGSQPRTMSIEKDGPDTLTLSGANSYSGPTTINNGTLPVNGTHTGDGAYTVNEYGTLGGRGSISGPTTIEAGGTLAPGDSLFAAPGEKTFGKLTLDNDLTLANDSTLLWEFVNNTAEGDTYNYIDGEGHSLDLPNGENDQVNLTIFGLTDDPDYSLRAGDSFTLFAGDVYQGSTPLEFGTDITDLFNIDDDNIGWWGTWEVTAGSLILTAVPEPGAALLALWALACGLLVRRRRG